ncbi:hypothetical protein L6164_031569 [Bauhinia variegata]|uniref:Uncharacterized protein n=1 Tax=Bauhinia variegata TaxID=167791 RepID=A0ACB9LHE9_BAUVA|nr:hypothetical protein L6164_031569 [Bauhinia variegata]
MLECLVSPVTNLVERLVNKLIDESYYCCCFNPIVEEFEKEKGNLSATEKRVKKDVETAKNAGQETEEEVKKWQQDAKDLTDIDTATKQKCFNLCPNCIWRYRRGKDLAQKTVEIKDLIAKSNFQNVGRPVEGPGIKFHSSPDYIDFESRKAAKKRLLDALANRNNYLIGLQGMAGCGKSKLVKQVGNEVQNIAHKLFDRVIYVVVSSSPDAREIQNDIASHLGLKLGEGKELELAERLWSRLTNGEKILIILDDVWEKLELNDLGIPLGKDHNGCCVLITSRNRRVCDLMYCQSLIELETLSKEDAWSLFRKHAALMDDLSNNFKKVGQKIVEECRRLPVVIAVIASTLRGRSLEYWKSALSSLENAQPIENTEEGLIRAYRSLQLSYDHLKSKEAQGLFLLCSLFPEDYEIPTEELTRFGVGLGIFGENYQSYEILRGKLISALAELIDSCLLQQPEQRHVSMHDLIRDVAQWIANQEIQSIIGPGGNVVKQSILRYLYCDNMDSFPIWLTACTKLEILVVTFDCRCRFVNIPEAFFEQMKSLKVLQLSWKNSILGLLINQRRLNLLWPPSTEFPQNLRTLRVKGLNLGDITHLEKLEKLETLELSYCSFNELPDGIVKLEKLRLLGLTHCILKKNPWEVIKRLPKIEELFFLSNKPGRGSEWGINTGFFAGLFEKNSVVQPLQRYQVDISESSERRYIVVSEDDLRTNALSVDHFDGFASHATIIDLARRAGMLQLNKIGGAYRNVIPDVVEAIGEMNELIKLCLISCSKIEYLIGSTTIFSSQGATIFNKLVSLSLANMDQLMELCHDLPPSDLFRELQRLQIFDCNKLGERLFAKNLNLPKLETLEVESCSILKSLFTVSTARSLVELKYLIIRGCNQLKNIITNEQKDEHQQQIYGSFFSKLEIFQIEDADQLEYIVPFSSLASLKHIHIYRCSQLKYMFGPCPNNKDQLLLQKDKEMMLPVCNGLNLNDLPNFVSIYPLAPEARQMKITSPSGSQAPNSNWFGRSKQPLTFGNIRNMNIKKCSKLKSLFTLSIEVSLLEGLIISDCDALRHIIENEGDYHNHINHGSVFPKLKCLIVKNCKLLEYLSAAFSGNLASLENITNKHASQDVEKIREENENQTGSKPYVQQLYFPSLALVVVKHCGNLKHLFSVSTASVFPELQLMILEDNFELKQVFASEQGRTNQRVQVVLPKLKYLVLNKLPGLANNVFLGIQFRPIEYCIVKDCPGLTISSTTTFQNLKNHFLSHKDVEIGTQVGWKLADIIGEDHEYVESQVEEALHSEMPSSEPQSERETRKVIVQQGSMSEKPPKKASIPSLEKESEKEIVGQGPMSKRPPKGAPIPSLEKETKKEIVQQDPMSEEPPKEASTPSQEIHSIIENVEVSPIVEKSKIASSSTHSETKSSEQDPLTTSLHETSLQSTNEKEKEIDQQCLMPEEPARETSTPSQEIIELACKDQEELGKTKFDMGIGTESIIENVEVGLTSEKVKAASSSVPSETRSSKHDPLVICQYETTPKNALEQALEENKRTHQITHKDDKPSDLQHMKGPSNEKKTSLQISSTIPELKGSTLTLGVTFPKKISPLISSIPKMNTAGSPSPSSGLILQPEALQVLKTELDAYLNLSLEAIFESNAFDNVERIINSLARGTADVIQRNILEDLASRLKNFKECIPQAVNTKQSSFEFMSNYENLNMELVTKLSDGQGRVTHLESKFSETCEEEYAIEMEIQQLITRKFEILARKNSLASQLDQSSQEVSKSYEEWKALGEELKLSTDQWLKSKEVLAHANASWRVFKESLRL